jgi:hypothetical protein
MIGQVAGLIVAKKVQPRLRARCAISDKRFMTLDFMRYRDLSRWSSRIVVGWVAYISRLRYGTDLGIPDVLVRAASLMILDRRPKLYRIGEWTD